MTDYSVFYVFATAAATGIATALLAVPLRALGRRFFILMSLIAVVLLALALVSAGLATGYAFLACATFLVLYNITLPAQQDLDPSTRAPASGSAAGAGDAPGGDTLGDHSSAGDEASGAPPSTSARVAQGALVVAILAGATGLIIDARAIHSALQPTALPTGYISIALLGSALQIGSAIVAMTLGHWYLVARGLSFDPLRRLTWWVGASVAARLLIAAAGVWFQQDAWSSRIHDAGWTSFFLADGVFITSSWLFGIAAPLVLVRLVIGCLDARSNQSATGILYVIVAFVLLGELLSKHYLLSSGLAI